MKTATYIFIASVFVVLLALTGNLTIWEDGSWAIGQFPYPLSGCAFPWMGCS